MNHDLIGSYDKINLYDIVISDEFLAEVENIVTSPNFIQFLTSQTTSIEIVAFIMESVLKNLKTLNEKS